MHKCPRFRNCWVPLCPLDPEMEKRDNLPGEPDCPLSKSKRYTLGEGLPMHGLTKREWAAKLNWERKSILEREKTKSRLKEFSFQPETPI